MCCAAKRIESKRSISSYLVCEGFWIKKSTTRVSMILRSSFPIEPIKSLQGFTIWWVASTRDQETMEADPKEDLNNNNNNSPGNRDGRRSSSSSEARSPPASPRFGSSSPSSYTEKTPLGSRFSLSPRSSFRSSSFDVEKMIEGKELVDLISSSGILADTLLLSSK